MDRLPHHLDLLLSLSAEEKIERVKWKNMRKRGIVIEEHQHWMVCINEMPFTNRWDIQYVVWYHKMDTQPTSKDLWYFMKHIRAKYNYLTLVHNATHHQTMRHRFHFHLFN